MAFCSECGKQLKEGAKFCLECGKEVGGNVSERKIVYEGEIRKCPYCGLELESGVFNCPQCGREIRGTKVSSAIHEFTLKLENAEDCQKRALIISSFPIPNNKEDIREFIILSSTNIKQETEDDILKAWNIKLEQCYEKAKQSSVDESYFSKIQLQYNEAKKYLFELQKKKRTSNFKIKFLEILPNIIVIFSWLISVYLLILLCGKNLDDVGFNAYQIILIIDFIAGTIILPRFIRHKSRIPIMLNSVGEAISIIILILLCGKNTDNVGFNVYQIIVIVAIISTIIMTVRSLKNK